MNVDCDNFHEVRKQIIDLNLIQKVYIYLSQSQYISFDLEFTGVKFQGNQRQRKEMFVYEKYQKMAAVASKYNIIQIGLTFILKNEQKKGQYFAYPYNFYVFPRESMLGDPIISLQAGCVAFNNNQNMDWNRWIKKGINFVKIIDMDRFRANDGKSLKEVLQNLDQINKDYAISILQQAKKLKIGASFTTEIPKFIVYSIKKVIEKFSQEKQIFFETNITYNSQFEDDKMAKINLRLLSQKQHSQNQVKKYESLIGFTLIFEQIWTSKKKLIGHNCLYDVLFIYESFVNKLPYQYSTFKELIKESAQFYDTKYLITQMEHKDEIFQKGTTLEEVFKIYHNTTKQNKALVLAPGFENYDLKNQVLHQAGFDSYLTAWAFFQVTPHVNVKSCQGKFNLFKSFYYMDIRKEDGILQDLQVFVIPVASYSKYIQLDELKKLKMQESKKLKNLLLKDNNLNFFNIHEGLKQIYIYPKEKTHNSLLIKLITQFKREKQIFGVRSICEWVQYRSNDERKKAE